MASPSTAAPRRVLLDIGSWCELQALASAHWQLPFQFDACHALARPAGSEHFAVLSCCTIGQACPASSRHVHPPTSLLAMYSSCDLPLLFVCLFGCMAQPCEGNDRRQTIKLYILGSELLPAVHTYTHRALTGTQSICTSRLAGRLVCAREVKPACSNERSTVTHTTTNCWRTVLPCQHQSPRAHQAHPVSVQQLQATSFWQHCSTVAVPYVHTHAADNTTHTCHTMDEAAWARVCPVRRVQRPSHLVLKVDAKKCREALAPSHPPQLAHTQALCIPLQWQGQQCPQASAAQPRFRAAGISC